MKSVNGYRARVWRRVRVSRGCDVRVKWRAVSLRGPLGFVCGDDEEDGAGSDGENGGGGGGS